MAPVDPAQAVDLSNLGKQPTTPQVTDCPLCGLRHRGPKHESLEDCLQTVLPYVEMFLELKTQSENLVVAVQRLDRQNNALLDANERLVRENDRLKTDLRTARKGTPEAAKSVLEGAEDLAASMKASVQPTTSSPTSLDAREYLKGMGVPEAEVDATPDEGLTDLYEKYARTP